MSSGRITLLVLSCLLASKINAEPWIGTDDIWLRSDIESLADIGVIKVPTSTFPLMWSGIIRDLDESSIEQIPASHKSIYWRVKKAVKKAVNGKAIQRLRLSTSNAEGVFRTYGDTAREKQQLSAKSSSMNKYFAWNFEVTHVSSPSDSDSNARFDNSYIAAVLGNWVVNVGKQEKWWGPTWFTSNLLSNNARPPLGINIQRNYSVQEQSKLLSWIGPWSLSAFAATLDDTRVIADTKLAGISLTAKPFPELEVGIRVTTLWGGEGREERLPELFESFLGISECNLNSEQGCDDYLGNELYSTTGDRLAGFDIKWRPFKNIPLSIYYAAYGENESELFPSKTAKQIGVTGTVEFLHQNWRWYVEGNDTSLDGENDLLYESAYYQTGYRYFNRPIGAAIDNDSKSIGIGLVGQLNREHSFSLGWQNIELNSGTVVDDGNQQNSLSSTEQKVSRLNIDWRYKTNRFGAFKVSYQSLDGVDELLVKIDNNRLMLEWSYYLN